MTLAAAVKTPTDVLDYDIDFSRWLPEGDYVLSAVAAVDPSTGTLSVDQIEWATDVVKVWLSAGADGETYSVDVLVTTNLGRVKTVCFTMKIRNCH